jgi:hypothetical protein
MAEYSKIIRGNFTSTGANKFISLPMVPDTIEIWNKTEYASGTNHNAISAIGFADDPKGSGLATAYNVSNELVGVAMTSGAFTFVSAGDYNYGPVFTITAINHTTGVVTTSAPHGYSVGDTVLIYANVVMKQIGGELFTITAVGSTTTFTINIGGLVGAVDETGALVKQLFYPDLYIPFGCPIVSITQAAQAVITTSVNHAFVVGQEVAFVIPSQWGMTQLDSKAYIFANNRPLVAIVVAVTARSITVNVNTTAFTAFAIPSAATAALGMSFAQVLPIGDQNFGGTVDAFGFPAYLGVKNGVIGIPGAFTGNTRQGVIVGTGDGTTVLHTTSDVIEFRAIFPDAVLLGQ